jgi:hypothetical protein
MEEIQNIVHGDVSRMRGADDPGDAVVFSILACFHPETQEK